MTDIDKLLEEYPLPWNPFPAFGVRDGTGRLVSSQAISAHDADLMLGLANALHAERQKRTPVIRTADEIDQIADVRRRTVANANRIGRAFEMIGRLERMARDGERFEDIEKRLDAIANAARGSDE